MQWANTRYVFNNHKSQSNVLVVYDEPHQSFQTSIPKKQRILFVSEPPSIKTYQPDYLNQFGIIVTPREIEGLSTDTKQHISQLAFPWHYGVAHSNLFNGYETYDSLKAMNPPTKVQEVSTIISSKRMNDKHKKRIEVTAFLQDRLGAHFHRLGRGFKEIDDKSEGIAPYAFHLVCENNDMPHFWTEKLADSYLGYALPIFSGCPNIGDYFPKDSYVQVDFNKPEETLTIIEDILYNPDFYQSRLSAIKAARDKILNEYNLFNVINDMVTAIDLQEPVDTIEMIKPQTPSKSLVQRVVSKAIAFIQRLQHNETK
ncbi:MAG: glycosyltransferase family 10 domain-containing protein [Bacteroidota bacterium]